MEGSSSAHNDFAHETSHIDISWLKKTVIGLLERSVHDQIDFTQVVQVVSSGPTKYKRAYSVGDLNDGALVGVWLFE